MKTLALTLAAGFAGLALGPAIAADQADQIIRGQYQAVLGDCAGCHTKPGGKPLAGGLPLETPFGALIPPNITPDTETGIGNWSEADFRDMMKTGVGHNGVRLYPAMPYPAYTRMTGQDISDLWAYLTTVDPVSNKVEANQLPFPLNIRLSMWGWNLLNFSETPFTPDPSKPAEWNRGAYIVQGAGHCGTCHTPKSFLGADKDSVFLQGASLQGWFAPDITNNAQSGLGKWSEDELVQYLKTGVNAHSIASGPMAEAVENSTSKMTDADLKAVAVYLKSLGSDTGVAQPAKPDRARMVTGEAIYRDNCSACHGGDGAGAGALFPALSNNSIVAQGNTETLAQLVLAGSQAVHTEHARTTPAMPSLAWRLSDQEVADVLTYVRNSWGNAAPMVSSGDVAAVRKELTQ
ncbi:MULTISPECIES: cytochrome c [unclassified Mesorhizobium]|uniref:c-type cytochrome n=1 Tax=unclassified Mesorhizobium TaxID=325217 RepID=UPI00112CC00E|nr:MULTISPECIES: cytochrome c [unclassified Mesorhizobium]TPL05543.1 c-type cytochrome [Mesorhizobium sp. B2-4-16]TPL75310.1 c-type cytochrome [Mesorhizobium sp. B2-4-3]